LCNLRWVKQVSDLYSAKVSEESLGTRVHMMGVKVILNNASNYRLIGYVGPLTLLVR